VLDALEYILAVVPEDSDLVINLSFGSTAGPHDGSSLLETAIDNRLKLAKADRKGRVNLVLPAGNQLLADLHGETELTDGKSETTFLWEVQPDDSTDNYLELWCPTNTRLQVDLQSPAGASLSLVHASDESFGLGMALIRSTDGPGGEGELILVALAPTRDTYQGAATVQSGIWKVKVSAPNAQSPVVVNAWVERDDPVRWQVGQPQCRLLSSTVDRDINAPDRAEDLVKRERTGNSLAYGTEPHVVGGYVERSYRVDADTDVGLSDYSAAARFDSGSNWLAVSDETDGQDGIAVAANLSDMLVRAGGTSMAAPQVARQLLRSPGRGTIQYARHRNPVGDLRDVRGVRLKRVG
jgi:hypothetical protein